MSRKVLLLGALPAAATYLILWAGLAGDWAWMTRLDDWGLRHLHDITAGSPGWISFWRGVSRTLSPGTLRIAAVVAIVIALIRRRPRIGAFLGATVILMGLVIVGAKSLSDRPRPPTALAFESSTSFPSGHALGITVAVLAFTTVLWPSLKPALRIPVVVLDVGLILLVGLSRVALNVHHPTDVVAGWTLGFLYYLLCLALVPPSRV